MTLRNALERLVTRDATWVDNMAATLGADGLEADGLEWLAERARDVGAKNPRGLLRTWLENGDWRCELRYRVLDRPPGDGAMVPEMDDRAWLASYLVVFEGQTPEQAAHALGCPVADVAQAADRLRRS